MSFIADVVQATVPEIKVPVLVDFWGKATSYVWEYFGFYARPDGQPDRETVVCKKCFLEYRFTGNTTNMASHLRRHHPEIPEPPPRASRPRLDYMPGLGAGFGGHVDGLLGGSDIQQQQQQGGHGVQHSPLGGGGVGGRMSVGGGVGGGGGGGGGGGAVSGSHSAYGNRGTNTGVFATIPTAAIHQTLLEYLVTELIPPDTVDSATFRRLIGLVNPGYEMPDASSVVNFLIPNKCHVTTGHIKRALQHAAHTAVAMETWGSLSGDRYVTVNLHMVSTRLHPNNFTLCTKMLPPEERTLSEGQGQGEGGSGGNEGEDVARVVRQVLKDWGLPESQPMTVAGLVGAHRVGHLGGEAGSAPAIQCLHDVLAGAVAPALRLPPVTALLTTIRTLLTYFDTNALARGILHQELANRQQDSGVSRSAQHPNLERDTPESWVSTHDMLRHLVEIHSAVVATLSNPAIGSADRGSDPDYEEPLPPRWDEGLLDQARDLMGVLHPLKMATDVVREQRPPSASLLLPLVAKLQRELVPRSAAAAAAGTDHPEAEGSAAHAAREAILASLQRAYQDTDVRRFLELSSLLDPRFKQLLFLGEQDRKVVRERLVAAAEAIHATHGTQDPDEHAPKRRRVEPSHAPGEASLQGHVAVKQEPHSPECDDSSSSWSQMRPWRPSQSCQDLAGPRSGTLHSHSAEDVCDSTATPQGEPLSGAGVGGVPDGKSIGLEDWFDDVMSAEGGRERGGDTSRDVARREVERYTVEDPVRGPPLDWWAARHAGYPLLRHLAGHHLATPAVSVTLHSDHGTTSRTLAHRRSALPPTLINSFIFIRQNHAKFKDDETMA